MVKTLEQLGLEYYENAQYTDYLIQKCNREIREAIKKRDFKKSLILKQKRLMLYSQKRDLMETAYKLQNYYKRKEESV